MAINFGSITKVVNEATQWVGLLSGLFEKAPKEVKEKLPMFLGLSLEDERRWGKLWTNLDELQREAITDFLEKNCKDYERNAFRHVVVGIPADEEKLITGKGNQQKTKIIPKENAVNFLKIMAETIRIYGTDEAYRQCVMGGIIVPDPFFQKIVRKWKEATSWCENNILEMLEVESFSEITPEKIISGLKKFDNAIASRIPVSTAGKSSKNLRQVADEDLKTPGIFETIFGFKL